MLPRIVANFQSKGNSLRRKCPLICTYDPHPMKPDINFPVFDQTRRVQLSTKSNQADYDNADNTIFRHHLTLIL